MLFRSTNSVLSNIDLTKTFPICGFLYGGSSSINDDGTPFSIVFDNTFDIISVITTPSIIIANTQSADTIDENAPAK